MVINATCNKHNAKSMTFILNDKIVIALHYVKFSRCFSATITDVLGRLIRLKKRYKLPQI